MIVLKKLFSGNYLKKLHIIKDNTKEISEDSNIINTNLDMGEENKIITKENINNKFYLISIYESSLDINHCEYDPIIKQYIQTPFLHQKFFFVIFDSEIINSKIVLLTSIGLFIYKFDKNKLELIFNDIFNIKCEPKDLLMYLKLNEKLNIIVVYSNTNLFFLYHYDTKDNSCFKINQINKLSKGYINYINIFDLENINNYFILDIQIKLLNKFLNENYVYYFDKEKKEINEINIKELKDDNNTELIIKQNIKYINDIYAKINENYNDEKINEIRYMLDGKYIFIINQNGFIILKNKKQENGDNLIDLMIKYKFKYGQNIKNIKNSFFIDYQKINNYHFLFFDNKISIFEEKEDILSRIKLVSKQDKKILTNSNAIFLDKKCDKEIELILYNYKNDISFINIKKEVQDEENINKYKINIITKITNESMFCLDSVVIKNNKDEYKIISICGLQGESRLIKYSNIFNEINLLNKELDSQIKSICFSLNNFKQNFFSDIFITSNNSKSNLYSLSKKFEINYLLELNSPALKIYQLNNNISYIIVLKYEVGLISFNDINNNNFNQYNLKEIYKCKNNEENIETNNLFILFSYYFIFKEKEYLSIYLPNRHIILIDLNSFNILFDIELNNLPQPSSLGVISIERLDELGFIFGNYIDNHITIIYYNMENKCFDKEKISETKLYDSSEKYLLIPEDILIYKYFIFITTHTGDFIILKFNDNDAQKSINIIFNLENITINKLGLKFSQINFCPEKNEFNIDFYNFKNAYNIKVNIIENNNEIICNNITQLTKYKFNSMNETTSLLDFQNIYSDTKKIKVHFYFKKNFINFSFFQD